VGKRKVGDIMNRRNSLEGFAVVSILLIPVILGNPLAGAGQQLPQMDQASRLKEHGKLYANYEMISSNLNELASQGTGDIELNLVTYGTWALGSSTPAHPYPDPFLEAFASSADAVVVGTTQSSVSALSEHQSFIFTDWTIAVNEVIKNNSASSIEVGAQIIVTRPGGTLVLNGRNVKINMASFLPFRQNRQYVLFLKYIPQTGAYMGLQDQTFELFQHAVVKMNPGSGGVVMENKQDPNAFLVEVRSAVAASSSKQ